MTTEIGEKSVATRPLRGGRLAFESPPGSGCEPALLAALWFAQWEQKELCATLGRINRRRVGNVVGSGACSVVEWGGDIGRPVR